LRFCIRPLNGTFVFLAIMDIRAHPISFSERPREAGRATRSRMRRRDRFSISLHSSSQTSAGKPTIAIGISFRRGAAAIPFQAAAFVTRAS